MRSNYEKARWFVLNHVAPSVAGAGGDNAAFNAACVLIKGFNLPEAEARGIMREWNALCSPPWSDSRLDYKLRQAQTAPDEKPRGYMVRDDPDYARGSLDHSRVAGKYSPRVQVQKAKFKPEALEQFARPMMDIVSPEWLRSRSEVWVESAGEFLAALYQPGEKVKIFNEFKSQGEWIAEVRGPNEIIVTDNYGSLSQMPTRGQEGIWFLNQPVDGLKHPNPRMGGRLSGRSEEAVTAWRYLVLESDEAERRQWVAALVRLPLPVAAIYTSGGKSIHALVRLDAVDKKEFDQKRDELKDILVLLGADPAAMTAVRLTRLPFCYREEKKRWQQLLYLCPSPGMIPIANLTKN